MKRLAVFAAAGGVVWGTELAGATAFLTLFFAIAIGTAAASES